MANILLQTTIPDIADDWSVARFSLLADELRRGGHEVTMRNREVGDDDSTSRDVAFEKIRARIEGTKLAEERLGL